MRLFDWFRRFRSWPSWLTAGGSNMATSRALKKGSRFYEQGDAASALRFFQKAASLNPACKTSQEMLGLTLVTLGRHDEALRAFAKLKELGHECASSAFGTFVACLELERHSEAREALDVSLQLRVGAALAANDRQKLERILLEFWAESKSRLEESPQHMEQICLAMARLFTKLNQSTPASEMVRGEGAVWLELCTLLRKFERYDGAEAAARTALRRCQQTQPRHDPVLPGLQAACHNNLGIVYQHTARPHAAKRSYLQALALREEIARANPGDLLNQLYLGGVLCNLGQVESELGEVLAALDLYQRAIHMIEPLRYSLTGSPLVEEFLDNCHNGLGQCTTLPADATEPTLPEVVVAGPHPGPPALNCEVADADLAAALREVDGLRLAGDPRAPQAAADLVARFPGCAEVWLLHALLLGHFQQGPNTEPLPWDDARHEAAIVAFHEALACQPEQHAALLYKGLELRQACQVSSVRVEVMATIVESMPVAEQSRWLMRVVARQLAIAKRACESLDAATRIDPNNGQVWYYLAELACLTRQSDKLATYLKRLKQVDSVLWEQYQAEVSEEP